MQHPKPKLTVVDGKARLEGGKEAAIAFMGSLNITELDFANGLLNQLVALGAVDGKPNAMNTNFLLATIRGFEPKDQLEVMLASQMTAIHNAIMLLNKQLLTVSTTLEQESAINSLAKLNRTFTAQVEAIKRYRSTNEQKITVQHINVNEGGQAVIGTIERGSTQKPEESHGSITHEPSQALPCNIQADKITLPSGGG
ncbi:MAG: hypothetical protein ABL933_17370 [Methyloglobulus sp.]|nr:hypothetical protein [Methyloglobulus sp.]